MPQTVVGVLVDSVGRVEPVEELEQVCEGAIVRCESGGHAVMLQLESR